MAPRETPKVTPKVQRTLVKTNCTKSKTIPTSTLKKTATSVKKPLSEKNSKPDNVVDDTRQRSSTVPKENKSVPVPGSVTKSAKKATWNRRPKPAHSGVPVPEKMRKYLQKRLQDFDCSL